MSIDAAVSMFQSKPLWAEDSAPGHPHFIDELRIRKIASEIKGEIVVNLHAGLRRAFAKSEGEIYNLANVKTRQCWELALRTHQYGRNYLLSRHEARTIDPNFLSENRDTILRASDLLADGLGNRIFNYAIDEWVQSSRRKVDVVSRLVPPAGIASISRDHIAVRHGDFFEFAPAERLRDSSVALFDLHDFAHQACATLSSELYGSKYFTSLVKLPKELTSLITSENADNGRAIPFSDGLVFSWLLVPIYDRLGARLGPDQCVNAIAVAAIPYFLGTGALMHPATGLPVRARQVITPSQLATLVQNKFYELPASEVEQKFMTRGGDDSRDPLKNIGAVERIRLLSNAGTEWFYFERRNTLRHRAHLETYLRVARMLLSGATNERDIRLLDLIIRSIEYRNYTTGGEQPNLWEAVYAAESWS
jgi:hypothetical protein